VNTPHIDRLAAEGMRFNMAYTSTAMCSPSRAQLYTGLFPVKSGAFPNHAHVKDGTKSWPHYLKALDYHVGISGKWHFGPSDSFPFESAGAGGNLAFVSNWMKKKVRKQRRFSLIYASNSPHSPWKSGNASQYNADKLEIPKYWVDTSPFRQALTRYYAEVSSLDNELGQIESMLQTNNVKNDTILIFTTEQGGMFPFAKWTCYEHGLNVGFVVRWPGVIKPGSVSNAMIHYVDVVPTLIDVGGGNAANGLSGSSFLDVLSGAKTQHNRITYGVQSTGKNMAGYNTRSIREGEWKYIMNLDWQETYSSTITQQDKEGYWASWTQTATAHARFLVNRYKHRPHEELYDLSRDPYELNNIAGNASHHAMKISLRAELLRWMGTQGDFGSESGSIPGCKGDAVLEDSCI